MFEVRSNLRTPCRLARRVAVQRSANLGTHNGEQHVALCEQALSCVFGQRGHQRALIEQNFVTPSVHPASPPATLRAIRLMIP